VSQDLSVTVRLERLMRFLVDRTDKPGGEVELHRCAEEAFALTEVENWSEMEFLLDGLEDRGLIKITAKVFDKSQLCPVVVTVAGHQVVEGTNR